MDVAILITNLFVAPMLNRTLAILSRYSCGVTVYYRGGEKLKMFKL